MTTQFPYKFALLIILVIACKSQIGPTISTTAVNDYAITNVSVLPMTAEILLKNQTITIKDGKITKIGKGAPTNTTTIIDGTGKFLLPGLTEMHAHIPVPTEDGDDHLVKETLFLYLSQGITTIRGMLGQPYHLGLRKQATNGAILSPRIYTSSPSLNGNSITTPAEAKEKITQYQKDGYDFLKIHPGIQLDVWEEVERTAKEVGIPYAGHVPVAVGIHRALAAKYKTVDHLDGYMEGLVPAAANVDPTKNGFFGYDFTELAEEALIEDLVEKTLQNKVGIVATQSLFTRWFSPEAPAQLGNQAEMKYMSPKTLYTWRQSKSKLISRETYSSEKWKKYIHIRQQLLKAMDKKGVTFLLGSDAPQVFNVPGFSIHRELEAMRDAGIANYKLLQAGTSNPATFFGETGKYGTIVEGAAADFILLNANPLADISHAKDIAGVMVGKTWLPKKEIDRRLAEIALAYAK